jgi:hypothetical protein
MERFSEHELDLMEFLLNRYRNLTVLLVVIVAQLMLIAYQVKTSKDVPLIRVWAVTAVTPIELLRTPAYPQRERQAPQRDRATQAGQPVSADPIVHG